MASPSWAVRSGPRAPRHVAAVMAAALVAAVLAVVPAAAAAEYSETNTAVWQTTGGGTVRALATDGDRVFLGGTFTGMRADALSATVPQAHLAAVDAATGVLDPAFAPQIDGEVRALALSEDGTRLYVAGMFATVNGAARSYLVALDPVTGATVTGFSPVFNNPVLDLAVDGDDLYAVGRFWNVDGQQREKIVRVDATTGAVDASWAPFSDGGDVAAVAVDPVLDRVYVGGFFVGIDGVPDTQFLAAVSRSTGVVVADFDPAPEGEVYDILARPGRLWTAQGGPGGQVDAYDTALGTRLRSFAGDGDLQVLAASGTDILAGGHHETGLGGGVVSQVSLIDGVTETVDPDFAPQFTSGTGLGVWALLVTDDAIWVGGAITGATPVDGRGILRYPLVTADPVDTTPPTDPGGLVVDGVSDFTVRLSWDPGVDDGPVVEHVVVRDGVPIGAVRAGTFIDTTVEPSTQYSYTVRAVDGAGNVSADAGPVTATTLGLLSEITPVPLRSTWRYLDSGAFPDPTWRDIAFDDTLWPVGTAELGVGDGDEGTVITNRTVNLFRRTFTLTADQAVAAATLRYLRDDGIVISVNGTEVVRDNVPAGPVGPTTAADEYVNGPAESELFEVAVDPELFVPGPNVIAVSLHNGPGSGDMSFDASLVLRVGSVGVDTTPPGAPAAAEVTAVTEGSARLAWDEATDNVAVTGYQIHRDGILVATVAPTVRSYTDGGLAPSTTYGWTVTALDAAGNTGPAAGPLTATTTAVPDGDVVLVDDTTVWAIDDSGTAPPADWTTSVAAPTTWRPGTTEIGVGDGGEATLVALRQAFFVRTTFDIGDPSAVGALTLDLLADDGAVVYLNGTEVVRDNVAPGPADQTTPASGFRWTVEEETVPLRWLLPAGLLQSGANVLAVSVHNGAGSDDLSFDATLTARYQNGPDTEAPSAPGLPVVTATTATTAVLTWGPAFDNVAVAGYRVLRDGVEVADVAATQLVDTGLEPATAYEYAVVAYDQAGNVGPASGPVTALTSGAVGEVVPTGALWRYLATGVDPGATWASPAFDDTAWPSGPAELGANDGDETTVVSVRPVVWFRTTFDLADPGSLIGAELELLADDGAVVYLNGVEVARDNMPAGPLTATTPALDYRWTAEDETAFRSFTIPVGGLMAGTNTLAVRVHQAPGSSDLSFAARLTVEEEGIGDPDTTPPGAPGTPVAATVTDTTAALTWVAAVDDVGVAGYEVLRDGVVVGTSFVAAYTDTGLTPQTAYAYSVRALDAAGNVGPASGALAVTTAAPQPVEVELLAPGATWRYLATGADPGPDWAAPAFDDTAWPSGPAELGGADGGEATVVPVRPVVWFRTQFDVTDLATLGDPVLELLADDGAVVYLNGVEVVRDNVAPGPVTATTAAADYRWSTVDETTRVPFAVPFGALVEGTNTVAVRVHQAPGSIDLSFEARLSAMRGGVPGVADTTPPAAPGAPVAGAVTSTSVELTWAAAVDDVGVARYEVLRDGVVVATTHVPSFTDTGLVPETTHSYAVRAADAAGNVGAVSGATDVTTAVDVVVPDFADDFSSGSLTPAWPTVVNATVVDGAARISPGGSASRIATSTNRLPQDAPFVVVSTRIRYDTLPALGTTADTLTIENQAGGRHFDLFVGVDGQLWFDLWSQHTVLTGIVPTPGEWMDVDVIVFFGSSTYEAWVVIDGQSFHVASPGNTASLVRQVLFGTASTAKTYQFDIDRVAILTSDTMPEFLGP